MSKALLSDIESFIRRVGISEPHFGRLAAKNGRLVERLRATRKNGRPARVWPETEKQIREFMKNFGGRKKAEAAVKAHNNGATA